MESENEFVNEIKNLRKDLIINNRLQREIWEILTAKTVPPNATKIDAIRQTDFLANATGTIGSVDFLSGEGKIIGVAFGHDLARRSNDPDNLGYDVGFDILINGESYNNYATQPGEGIPTKDFRRCFNQNDLFFLNLNMIGGGTVEITISSNTHGAPLTAWCRILGWVRSPYQFPHILDYPQDWEAS